MRKFAEQIDEQLHYERERVTSPYQGQIMISSKTRNFNLHLFGITYAPASHASCEVALRTLLRRTEALAEQSMPPSLQAFLADTAGLEHRKELLYESI